MTFEKAKEYAFLLLKYRLRSEKEIFQRLKRKKYPEGIINKTIDFLKEKKFLDDNFFARAWTDSRVKRSLGLRRIKQELKLKGIPEEIITSSIQEKAKSYCEEEVVFEIVKNKLERLKGIEQPVAKRRVYGYLLRRGFSPDIAIETINKLCKRTS